MLKPLLDRPADGAPWVIGQLGQSLDGCIATRGGDSNYVNGQQVLLHLHRLRALCDAVIVGAGTAAIDNPQLTTRRVPGANPVRVRARSGACGWRRTLRVFTDGQAPTLLACDATRAGRSRRARGRRPGAGRAGPDGRRAARWTCAHCCARSQQRGLRVLFVEGGGVTVSRFIAQGCMDRLHLSVAPVIIGDGRPGLQLPPSAAMRDCLRPAGRVFRMGADVLWDLDLRAASRWLKAIARRSTVPDAQRRSAPTSARRRAFHAPTRAVARPASCSSAASAMPSIIARQHRAGPAARCASRCAPA